MFENLFKTTRLCVYSRDKNNTLKMKIRQNKNTHIERNEIEHWILCSKKTQKYRVIPNNEQFECKELSLSMK